ncbi:unnamed protein product [Bursaphelenchus xylophilus]|uniref:Methanethiol oxidase n=1 Tax=Bursaphelenchus xylophilus TaxID=6326 RepID=A0A1I7SL83_BURXY|nr:unnamed protein product [Bursaphelenchus xylophilus]CAG9129407.1 unnamed protein product [Bursaphelenchus xylophilus]
MSNEKGCDNGICFTSPEDAIKAPRERVLIINCVNTAEERKPDALITVDVDPGSQSYGKILCKLDMPNVGDELHHSGWNACAGCRDDDSARRSHLVLPCLHSSRVYIIDTRDPQALKIHKIIEPKEFEKLNATAFHTPHCTPEGEVVIGALGDNDGNNKGDLIVLDSKTFEVKGNWPSTGMLPKFHYDFWYQPRHNVLLSSEWAAPKTFKNGFSMMDVLQGKYGKNIHLWDYNRRQIMQTLELDNVTGQLPFEVRFKHNPDEPHAFIGTALGSSLIHVYKDNFQDPWKHEVSITIPPKVVASWTLPTLPAMITDILISMDDKYLYASCWFFGEVRQYNIEDPYNIKLTGRISTGGMISKDYGLAVLYDPEGHDTVPQLEIKGVKFQGGPQMIQLSLDGRRLYITNSLYSVWDKQFYPDMSKKGGQLIKADIDIEHGGMKIDPKFIVDFGSLEDGPYGPHDMRYPGGDCTSDIFV